MASEPSLWSFIANAGPLVKVVMLILLAASVYSWTIIFQRMLFFQEVSLSIKKFEQDFWSGHDLAKLYQDLSSRKNNLHGLELIFYAGFGEYIKLNRQVAPKDATINAIERVMQVTLAKEIAKLEQNLPFLATIGSTSPYVGLFGTVWGIMTSFRALGGAQQATMAMVAPGISEALIATAMGLFAAIPAVVAYNRYASQVEKFANIYDNFTQEFASILYRQNTTTH